MNSYEEVAMRAIEILKTQPEAKFAARDEKKAHSWRRSFYTMRGRLWKEPPYESPYDKLEIQVRGSVIIITDQPILEELPNG